MPAARKRQQPSATRRARGLGRCPDVARPQVVLETAKKPQPARRGLDATTYSRSDPGNALCTTYGCIFELQRLGRVSLDERA